MVNPKFTGKFSGLPKDLFKFIKELSENNNREWFSDNKQRYHESIANPVCDFVAALAPKLEKISRYYVADSRSHGGSMFRIYRDTRFAKDKRPYKEHVACQFRHVSGKDAHAPGFYLHIEHDLVRAGGGIWFPPALALNQIRKAIAEKPEEWQKVVSNRTFINRFGEILGDKLQRPPRGYQSDHPQIEHLKRKSHFVMQHIELSAAQSPELLTQIERIYKAVSPLMAFLTQALALPYHPR